MLTQGIAEQY